MKLMMQTCLNIIPDKVEPDDLKSIFDHYKMCAEETKLCWRDLMANAWDNAEVRADFGKAVAEQVIMSLTLLKAMEKMDGIPKNFTPALMAQVFYEHYAKGYHDADFEMEVEE